MWPTLNLYYIVKEKTALHTFLFDVTIGHETTKQLIWWFSKSKLALWLPSFCGWATRTFMQSCIWFSFISWVVSLLHGSISKLFKCAHGAFISLSFSFIKEPLRAECPWCPELGCLNAAWIPMIPTLPPFLLLNTIHTYPEKAKNQWPVIHHSSLLSTETKWIP